MNEPNDDLESPQYLMARWLRAWRRQRGIPLKQMAADLGVSSSVISAWENGRRFPSVTNLAALSSYTAVPVCQFLYHGEGDCPSGRQNRLG
ncbi:MAG: helix-turn-helix transcriptional regulator [Verrucomicrobiota bacterium]|jgi:transcriptional regulator with XRE-family HTH domain